MKIKYYGVRGSIPTPSKNGFSTARYGGNTSCVAVTADSGEIYVLDAGTGIRELGRELMNGGCGNGRKNIALLLSHLHWDHIQGIPFFGPAYSPEYKIRIYSARGGDYVRDALERQQNGKEFPVAFGKMPGNIEFLTLENGQTENGVRIGYCELSHPGSAQAYSIEENGRKIVYASDNELEKISSRKAELVEFVRGADVLVHDAQYTPEEYALKKGWGHSTYEKAVELAIAADVSKLVLFHHEPEHDDKRLDEIAKRAYSYFAEKCLEMKRDNQLYNRRVIAAYEGLEQKL